MFLIEKDSCRSFIIKEGEDITDYFFFEKSFATDFASFLSNQPSLLNLVCQEDTIAYERKKIDLEALYRKNLKFSEIGRILADRAFIAIEDRMWLLPCFKI